MNDRCYILSATQVSCQKPLSDEWMTAPILYGQSYVRAMEPDSKEFIASSEARRMSRILRRAMCTALKALNLSGVKQPDAIITGTGMGCIENSEKFLIDLGNFGESCLKPTLFMQSTHNTISSLIAIMLKNHGYNNTYSHKGISFDSALMDAWLQIRSGAIKTALVGAHDEVTPFLDHVMNKAFPNFQFVSEASVSAVVSSIVDGHKPVCEIESIRLLYKPSAEEIKEACKSSEDSVLMVGINGSIDNDRPYEDLIKNLDPSDRVIKYKHLFGENFSSSAIALYVATKIFEHQYIPAHLFVTGEDAPHEGVSEIVIVNHSDGTSWSVIRLSKV